MGSESAEINTKPHAVLIPYPAQGHVTPMMQLAKLLHSKDFHITFVNTEFNHRRLLRSRGPDALKGLPDFQFKTIPDGLPPSDRDATQDIPALCASIRKTCLAEFVALITNLNASPELPPVTCIVSDGVMTFGIKAGEILGLPVVSLWTASACGLVGYLQYGELVRRRIVPFKDENFLTDGTLEAPVDWIPGVENLRLKDLPSFMRITDIDDIMFDYLDTESNNCLKSSAIIFNTFDEFEREALEYVASRFPRNNMYPIGPLPLLCRHMSESDHFKSFRTSLWKEDSECLKWLDEQEPNSIVYVNYGSITVMTDEHLKEFAWGLANSKLPFLWILRPDVVEGSDDSAVLPPEFYEDIKDRGLIVSWCPQDQVLSHPSIGVFLTHCGWNSTLETVIGGVPVICWPFFAEQQTNRRFACTNWGMGMEINDDVKRDEVESLVKDMMEGEKGKQMRQKVQEWKRKAEETTDIKGKSYNNFDRLVKEALLQGK